MKNIKSLFVLCLLCFTAAFSFAHGKGDIEEIEVDNVNSWKENFDLEGKTIPEDFYVCLVPPGYECNSELVTSNEKVFWGE